MKVRFMKLIKQIIALLLVVATFVFLDVFFYNTFTRRYITNTDENFKAKSIDLYRYLPFDEASEAVISDTDLVITGDLPVLDGAAALYPVFSSISGSLYPEDSVIFDGSDFVEGSALRMNNTRGSYERIVTGEDDIIFCAYPSQAQLQFAQDNGVELVFVPIGREAFVFFVNENNPIDNLTVDQIRDIYAGRIRNWSEVGGYDHLISPLQRNQGSGSQTMMESFMGGEAMPRDIDAAFGRAIAFSFRYYVSELTDYGHIKLLQVNGVYPSSENIANGSYPIASEFYAVYRSDNDNPNIPIIIDWILSEEGQQLIEDNGYVRLSE